MRIVGRVERRVVAKGTKSERVTAVLVAAEGEFILRRAQFPPFGEDGLDPFVGRNVACEGILLQGSTFEAREIKTED
jgi:hypothetical protein